MNPVSMFSVEHEVRCASCRAEPMTGLRLVVHLLAPECILRT